MRFLRPLLLLLAYALIAIFGVLAVGSFYARDLTAGALCLVLAGLAFCAVLKGEAALDAQALHEFERELVD
ncbi:hypothetical protein J2W28_001030 [Variovorax boronicumulans]|uniref:hypothetical protein n=1 Tax=Variovorax boronicumulans TaxID=436515 RepID=UPI002789F94C|nr:hypothetical protein [Variovorax boronicumulans]MDP9992002.1 hypothetical protein [Variovorax boronicumulans]MDQ0001897.1 hypothetical protein [Variovorax boronicumulans]